MVRGAKTIAEFKIRKHLEKLEERGLGDGQYII